MYKALIRPAPEVQLTINDSLSSEWINQ